MIVISLREKRVISTSTVLQALPSIIPTPRAERVILHANCSTQPPRTVPMNATSNASSSRIPNRGAATPIFSARLPANVINDKTPRTHMSGRSTSGFEPNTIADIIPVVERRVPSRHSPQPTIPITASPIPSNTASNSSSRAHQCNPSTSAFEPEPDIDDIIQTVERLVHQSEV